MRTHRKTHRMETYAIFYATAQCHAQSSLKDERQIARAPFSAQFPASIALGIAPIELIERSPMRTLNPVSKMSTKLRDFRFLCICELTADRLLAEVAITSLPFVSTAGRKAASPEVAFAFSTHWRQAA